MFHWRSHVAVALCVAAGTAVLTGALLVGDSMRGSLRDITLDRLGRVDFALSSQRLFDRDLASRFYAGMKICWEDSRDEPGGDLAEPALLLRGSVARVDDSGQETSRAGRVQVCGVNKTFWELNRAGKPPAWSANWDAATRSDSVVLNESLAREIGVSVGDTVLVRVEKPSEIPREAVLGRKDDLLVTLRLPVSQIVSATEFGDFKLDASQRSARNVFLPLDRLAEAIGHAGQSNTLFVSAIAWDREAARTPSEEVTSNILSFFHRALADEVRLDDFGLRTRISATRGYVSLESRRMVLDPAAANAAVETARELELRVAPTLAYLANSISAVSDDSGDLRSVPYSVVAAFPIEPTPPFGPLRHSEGEPADELGDDEILLNTWAADDLNVRAGDHVKLNYYVAEPSQPFETAGATFRVRGVVEIEGVAADSGLVPEYPGITDAKRYSDWDPPFPMDLKRVRPKDEEYWQKHRATPKAFVSLATGERLWGSRFGKWTSIRLASSSPSAPLGELQASFEKALLKHLRPEQFGLAFRAVRAEGLAASRGGTDFGWLFLAFSFFLIVSAAILIGLVFRLGVERRAKQVGLLLALGFDQSGVRRLLIAEGLIVAVLGTVVGLAGAVGYAWLVMAGLRTWWFAAVGTPLLRLHVPPSTLAIGAVCGLILAALAITISLRGLMRLTPRALLSGSVFESLGRARSIGRLARVSVVTVAVFCIFVAFMFQSESPLVFFIFGAVMLITLLTFVAARMDATDQQPVRGSGVWAVARLGVRNAYGHRGRSVLTAGLVAFATFVIVAVGANRRNDESSRSARGETRLVAETSVPLLHDLNTAAGRRELGLPKDSEYWLSGVTVSRFRVKEGEDASCLNLYQPTRPRILGMPDEALMRGIIKQDADGDVVPAIGDANSVKWILHLGLGDRLPITAEDGQSVDLQIVGLLERSVFQSELLISEANFRNLFPSQAGYSYFLIESKTLQPSTLIDPLSTLLEQHLSDYGFDATSVADRLAEYHAVENTYLATFQMLGGLGLMLGTLGLGAVLLRSVLERRGELALLLAVGFRPASLAWLVLAETGYLLAVGLATGTVSAVAAVTPHLLMHSAEVPWGSLFGTLVLVLAFGLLSSGAAVLATLRTPLLPALRSE